MKIFVTHGPTYQLRPFEAGEPELLDTVDVLQQIAETRKKLDKLGADLGYVAVSERIRTWQTANEIGAQRITATRFLNEVPRPGMTGAEQQARIAEGLMPQACLTHGQALYNNLPRQQVMVGHCGLLAGFDTVYRIRHGLPVDVPPLQVGLLEVRVFDFL